MILILNIHQLKNDKTLDKVQINFYVWVLYNYLSMPD